MHSHGKLALMHSHGKHDWEKTCPTSSLYLDWVDIKCSIRRHVMPCHPAPQGVTPVMQAAQQSSDKPTALQQQLTAAQTDLAAAEQALQQLSQNAALASTGSQTVEDSRGDISHLTCNCPGCMSKKTCCGLLPHVLETQACGPHMENCTMTWLAVQCKVLYCYDPPEVLRIDPS